MLSQIVILIIFDDIVYIKVYGVEISLNLTDLSWVELELLLKWGYEARGDSVLSYLTRLSLNKVKVPPGECDQEKRPKNKTKIKTKKSTRNCGWGFPLGLPGLSIY